MDKNRFSEIKLILWISLAAGLLGCGLADDDEDWISSSGGEADMDGDVDMDTDTDTDADADYGESTGDDFPPEEEEEAIYMAPQGAGRYVFIADEQNDAVVVVDSETLAIQVVEVGKRPTHLVVLSEEGGGQVAVINLHSDEVTLVRIDDQGRVTTLDLPVRPDTNALAPSPDGRYVIAFHDPRFTDESGVPGTTQEISVIHTASGKETARHLSVGMNPWKVLYDQTVTRAFVITEQGIDIIDLDATGDEKPDTVSPYEGGTYDSKSADIEIMPDGSVALARKTGLAQLTAAWLDDSGEKRIYPLPAIPTDLDLATDGSFGVLVFRAISQVAFFDLPLPASAAVDPFTYLDLTVDAPGDIDAGLGGDAGTPPQSGIIAGVATLSPEGQHVILHTTTAGEDVDKRRLTLLAKDGGVWQVGDSVVLERPIRSVAAGVQSLIAVVEHQQIQPGQNQQPYAYSLVTVPKLQVKFQQVPEEPGQLLLTPDGDFGYLLLEQARRVDRMNLRSFIVDELALGTPPLAAGYASVTDKVFVSQDHATGRMTFIGVHDSSFKTVTGFNLNNEIEY